MKNKSGNLEATEPPAGKLMIHSDFTSSTTEKEA